MKTDSKDNSVASSTLGVEHKVSDSVAESVVLCLEEVLKKCQLGSVDQVSRAFFIRHLCFHCYRLHCEFVCDVFGYLCRWLLY